MTDMNTRILARAIPGLLAVALLALVGATPAPPQFGYPSYFPAPCDTFTQTSPGASTAMFGNGDGVIQPLLPMNTLAACSLHVEGTGWSYAMMTVREWDPLALAPDPTTVALRTTVLNPSGMDYYRANRVPWMRLSPPLVMRSVEGVAQPPLTTLSTEVRALSTGYEFAGYYDPEGDGALAEGGTIAAGGTHDPLTGGHPVLGHAVCEGDPDLQSLAVAQCVRQTETRIAPRPLELLQRFRVPEPVELDWVELAYGPPNSPALMTSGPMMPAPSYAQIAIVEDRSGGPPPASMPPPLVLGQLDSFISLDDYYAPFVHWRSHTSFDQTITLEPGHDYWIWLLSAAGTDFCGHTLTGSEGAAFTAGIGPLHTRTLGGDPWTLASGLALSFKIVGQPTAPLGVPRPHVSGDQIQLAVAPNPANGAASITWSGAVGPVRLEVFDARGRRVARSDGGAAGTWSWTMSGRDGRPLSAGVYLVHARDSAGGHSVRRIVVYR